MYSCHKTSIEPNNYTWGYICAIVFGILFLWSVSIIVKNQSEDKNIN